MMTIRQFVRALAKRRGSSLVDARRTVDVVFDVLIEQVRKEGAVWLPGVGIFRHAHRKAKRVLNPVTREPLETPAHTTITLQASRALRVRTANRK